MIRDFIGHDKPVGFSMGIFCDAVEQLDVAVDKLNVAVGKVVCTLQILDLNQYLEPTPKRRKRRKDGFGKVSRKRDWKTK